MITCKVGENIINCYDGIHSKEQLKKWASKNILICPVCEKPYEYCHGEFVSPYFRHKDKCECEDRYSEPESQEHINGKRDLYEWIKNQYGVTDAVLEGWIPETKQRPDIMFKYNGKQYVIEYQCSPIASEYVERHELYQAGGIEDIWILGTINYFNYINQNQRKNRRGRCIEKEVFCYYDSIGKIFLINNWHSEDFNIPNIQIKCRYNYIDAKNNIDNEIISIVDDTIKLIVSNLNNFIFNSAIIFDTNIKIKIEQKYENAKNEFYTRLRKYLESLVYDKDLLSIKSNLYGDIITNIDITFESEYADNNCVNVNYDYYDDNCFTNIINSIERTITIGKQRIESNKDNDILLHKINSEIIKYRLQANYYPNGNIYYNSKFVINSKLDDELYFFIKNGTCDCCSTYECYYNNSWHTKYKTLKSFNYEFDTSKLKEFIYRSVIQYFREYLFESIEIIEKRNIFTNYITNNHDNHITILKLNNHIEYDINSLRFRYLKDFDFDDEEYIYTKFLNELIKLDKIKVKRKIFLLSSHTYYLNDEEIINNFKKFGFTNVNILTPNISKEENECQNI